MNVYLCFKERCLSKARFNLVHDVGVVHGLENPSSCLGNFVVHSSLPKQPNPLVTLVSRCAEG